VKLSTYLIGIPVVVIAAVVAIANRQLVTFSLDPFSGGASAKILSFQSPLFVLLLITFALGAAVGGFSAILSRAARGRARGKAETKSGLPVASGGAKPPEA
jgi:carbon starvation protein CstA